MGRTILLILLSTAFISSTAGCTGGCWLKADAVRTDPNTDCLALFGSKSASDPIVCGTPNLGGVNNCRDALTFPKRSATDNTIVFAPGQVIDWWVPSQSVPPAIMVNPTETGGGETYVISATLGNQSVTITIPVHGR